MLGNHDEIRGCQRDDGGASTRDTGTLKIKRPGQGRAQTSRRKVGRGLMRLFNVIEDRGRRGQMKEVRKTRQHDSEGEVIEVVGMSSSQKIGSRLAACAA